MNLKRFLAIPVLAAMGLVLSGCHVLNQNDAYVSMDGSSVFAIVLRDTDFYNDGGGNPYVFNAWDTIYADLDANCGPSGNNAHGSWGTPGSTTSLPDSTLINCANAEIQDDPNDDDDPASFICFDGDAHPDEHDCQYESSYSNMSAATDAYRAFVNEDPGQFVTAIRDWAAQTSPESYCLGYTTAAPNWTRYTTCPG